MVSAGSSAARSAGARTDKRRIVIGDEARVVDVCCATTQGEQVGRSRPAQRAAPLAAIGIRLAPVQWRRSVGMLAQSVATVEDLEGARREIFLYFSIVVGQDALDVRVALGAVALGVASHHQVK
jgi:hypothetical protein